VIITEIKERNKGHENYNEIVRIEKVIEENEDRLLKAGGCTE